MNNETISVLSKHIYFQPIYNGSDNYYRNCSAPSLNYIDYLK